MNRKILLWVAKCILSIAIAVVILSSFCFFYYNPPTHESEGSEATGYVRQANKVWSRMIEGFAHGKTDQNGYNNAYPSDGKNMDMLMMGSSQSEGLYVDDDKCLSYLLNEYFDQDKSDHYIYNVAMSAHTLYDNVNNLEKALDQFQPGTAVCLETTFMKCYPDMAEPAVNHTLEEPAITKRSGILGAVEHNPFIKLIYLQYSNKKATNQTQKEDVKEKANDDPTEEEIMEILGVDRLIDAIYTPEEESATYMMLSEISRICSQRNITPLIYYIPTFYFDEDNRLCSERDDYTKAVYETWCSNLGIVLVDPTDLMMQEYEKNHVLVSGFDNTVVNYGHLNERGHEILAHEIYKALNEKVIR